MITEVFIEQKFDFISFLGDIHGDYDFITWYLRQHKLENIMIIQVGDFQVGFNGRKGYEKASLKQVNKFLKEKKCRVFAFRGNHDNPAFFEEDKFEFSNIHFIKDYSILNCTINTEKIRVLCIGGAISIDRKKQDARGHWFPDEVMKFITDEEELKKISNINIIATHTAPSFLPPFMFSQLVFSYSRKDETLLDELIKERDALTKMMRVIFENNKDTLTNYFYGHFHYSETFHYENVHAELLKQRQVYSLQMFY